MKQLLDIVKESADRQTDALLKHLAKSGIKKWRDLTKSKLSAFRDTLTNEVAASSARTYCAALRAIIARYDEDVKIPCKSYAEILRVKNEKPVKTWLTPDELSAFETVETRSPAERLVKYQFLIGAYTGMRISDIRTVSEANIRDGVLTYVSQKTSTAASVPCGNRLAGWIRQANDCCEYVSLAGYNKALRRLCRRAGINGLTKVFSAGKTETGEKWMFVSSHTARISFATNLAECGAPLLSISRLCGHSSTSMTQRYIVTDKVTLNDRAMEYLNK